MSRYTTTSRFTFEPVAEAVDLATVAINYVTPVPLRERLNALVLVAALRGTARFYMTHDSSQGTAVVRLTDGVRNLLENEVDLSASPVSFSQPVDLSLVSGSAALYWEVEVTGAGTASSVGRVIADLTAETPLFVTAGQC
ncbi:hypothetical protein [Marinobacter salarius]|uniref:hypothetical protein n=1 Tax=Marinobacter salarius TaxID=1420917 RepID=UPI003D096CC7